MEDRAIAAMLAGALGSLLTFLGMLRRQSGRIATTDAESLWREVNGHIGRLNGHISLMERRIGALETEVAGCNREKRDLMRRIDELMETKGASL